MMPWKDLKYFVLAAIEYLLIMSCIGAICGYGIFFVAAPLLLLLLWFVEGT